MKVILQHNVDKLGRAGDVVEAAAGYFRNYLEPRRLAVKAIAGTLKKREEDLEMLKRKAADAHDRAVELARSIDFLEPIRIITRAGETGKLYGRVTNKEIAAELAKRLNVDVDKRDVKPQVEISVIGAYRVEVKVAAEVRGEFTLEVALDETSPVLPVTLPAADEKLGEKSDEDVTDGLSAAVAGKEKTGPGRGVRRKARTDAGLETTAEAPERKRGLRGSRIDKDAATPGE